MSCPNIEECDKKFNDMHFAFLHRVIKVNYCNGDYQACRIKQLLDRNMPVPENLMPNGEEFRCKV
jgi:hypothetical protein